MADVPIKFSFLKFYNFIKHVHRELPSDEFDKTWLAKDAPKEYKERFARFKKWCQREGIQHPKVQYPVLFGKGESRYPGMLALEDIGPNEPVVKVPSKHIINTKVCYNCPELQHVFFENPETFGRHTQHGDDNVFNTYILFHLNLGEASRHYEMMSCWPRPHETDILMNWTDEDLEWLQDETLAEDAQRGYEEFTTQWNQLYKCLRQYPDILPEKAIGLNKFKYVYMLTTNRCFSSNWEGVSQMVPFADYVNHENVDTGFDSVDEFGMSFDSYKESLKQECDEAQEKWRQSQEETRDSVMNLKKDILEIEIELRQKMKDAGMDTQSEAEQRDQALDLKLLAHVQNSYKAAQKSLDKMKGPQKHQEEDDCEYSSGLSSDGDIDMMQEMDILRQKNDEKKKKKQDNS